MAKRRVTESGEVRWDVRLRDPSGRQYSKTFRTRKEADRYRSMELADQARGSWIDPQAGQITFASWASEWLEAMSQSWRSRTTDKHRMAVDTHWLPRFGALPLNAISPRDVQAAVNELGSTHKSASVRTYYGTLRSLFKYAVEREIIGRTPCRSIKLPAADSVERRVLEPHEVHRLANAIEDPWRCMIYLAGVMGLRFGEAAALRVCDVDLRSAELFVRRTLVESSRRIEFGLPKSGASERTLIIPEPLIDELCGHLLRYRLEGDELLFTSKAGRPLQRSRFRTDVFLPAVQCAGLDGVTFHGLRHSAATRWVSDGVDLRTVQAWLGHADPQLVLRLYAHASTGASRRAANLVSESYWPSA